MNLGGKTALVTGASQGIGRAICIKLAELGANIVINYYPGQNDQAMATADLCRRQGVQTLIQSADVTSYSDCLAMFDAAKQLFGPVDILVNNAGITRDKLVVQMTEEDFSAVLNTNLTGSFICSKLAFSHMSRTRSGRIVNISSVVGIGGNAGQANYAASKAGVIGLTKACAKEFARRNITVNAVAPGFIQTEMTAQLSAEQRQAMLANIPLQRLGTADDVANLVAFLCSEQAAYITGQVLPVDGGMQM